MSKRILITGGCSIVYGLREEKHSRWTKRVAELTNREHIDVSVNGACNDMIAKTIAVAIEQHAKPGNDIAVYAGWTGQMRLEYFEQTRNVPMCANVNDRPPYPGERYDYKMITVGDYTIPRYYITDNFWSVQMGFYNFLHARNYVEMLCKYHNIKFVERCSLKIIPSLFGTCTGSEEGLENMLPAAEKLQRPLLNKAQRVLKTSVITQEIVKHRYRLRINESDTHPQVYESAWLANQTMEMFGDILGS